MLKSAATKHPFKYEGLVFHAGALRTPQLLQLADVGTSQFKSLRKIRSQAPTTKSALL
jgi:hypothetical protein